MRSRIVDRPLALLGAVVLASLLGASPLAAQCTITGPAATCGGTVQLCGPDGSWSYEWIGPNGFSAVDRCVFVSMPGTYTLYVFDTATGASSMCEHTLSAGVTPIAWITGPTEGCLGGTVELCGPPGDFLYAWTFPNGATASTQCVSVGVSGTYTLRVTDRASGCSGWPANHTVTFTTCGGDPPPPPPPAPSIACPQTASFWSAQCGNGYDARRSSRRLEAATLGTLAACVDEQSLLFGWEDARDGLCATLKIRSHSDLRARTRRQYAAVLANVCAASAGLATSRGAAIGLDPGQRLTLDGAPATLGEWLAATDPQLVELEPRRLADREVTAAYRAILRVAWLINHGQGLETVCPRPESATARATGPGPDDEVTLEPDDRSLAMVLGDPVNEPLRLESAWPNPFQGETRLAFALATGAPVRVTVVDLAGRAVRVLADGAFPAGRHELSWDGRADDGRMLPGGVYFVNASLDGRRIQSRLTLLR